MLHSYEAIYDHGQLKWLKDAPKPARMRVIVTVLEEESFGPTRRRQPPPELAGRGRILGDIISPVVPPEDWEVLR
jgi:hypothetical protein